MLRRSFVPLAKLGAPTRGLSLKPVLAWLSFLNPSSAQALSGPEPSQELEPWAMRGTGVTSVILSQPEKSDPFVT